MKRRGKVEKYPAAAAADVPLLQSLLPEQPVLGISYAPPFILYINGWLAVRLVSALLLLMSPSGGAAAAGGDGSDCSSPLS